MAAALAAWGVALTVTGCGPGGDRDGVRRVVLVSIDTLRADHVGAYGDAAARTPTLDGLAAAGVRFDHAISPAPLTLPSHSTLMTGLNPPQHGVRDNSTFHLASDVPTLAEQFHAGGFATAAFIGALVLDRRHGLDRGFDHYGDTLGLRESGGRSLHFPERTADRVVDEALAWLEQAPDRFFVWVHLFDPHAIYAPPSPWREAFPDSPYDGEVAFADEQLGRLLAAVEERWPDGRTLMVAVADHGENLGEHGSPTHGHTVYDATQRVPLLIRGPGVPVGTVVEAVVRLADVTPTILARVGLPPIEDVSGRDLAPLWSQGAEGDDRLAYVETLATQFLFGWSPLLGVRNADYKYVRAPIPELYALESDPGELHNVYDAYPEVAAALDRRLDEQLVGARPVQPTLTVSDEDQARLEALGYVVGNVHSDDANLGVVGGADPKEKAPAMRAFFRANDLMSADRPADALAVLDGVPEERGVLFDFLRAEAHLTLGNWTEAERYARAVIDTGTRLESGYLALGRALWPQGRETEAIEALEQSAALNPGSASPSMALAEFAEQREDWATAEEHYRRAITARDGSLNARIMYAALLMRRGRPDEADRMLAEIPEGATPRTEAVIRLAQAEAEAGRGEAAVARVRRAMSAQPDNAKLAFAYGSLLHRTRPPAEVLAASERALMLEPESPVARNNVAWLLVETGGDLDRALSLSQQAVAGGGGEPGFYDTLASIHLRRQEPAAAREAAERGLARAEGVDRARLLYVRAESEAALGEKKSARDSLSGSLALLTEDVPPPWAEDAVALAKALDVTVPAELRQTL